ncbi:hypothetical protein Droror1_Dr00009183 [Drosera rotundifolia]
MMPDVELGATRIRLFETEKLDVWRRLGVKVRMLRVLLGKLGRRTSWSSCIEAEYGVVKAGLEFDGFFGLNAAEMRIDVQGPGELQQAKTKAAAAFGNDGIYWEKFIQNPRHVQFQSRTSDPVSDERPRLLLSSTDDEERYVGCQPLTSFCPSCSCSFECPIVSSFISKLVISNERMSDADRVVKAIDCLDWSEVKIQLSQFMEGYMQGHSSLILYVTLHRT